MEPLADDHARYIFEVGEWDWWVFSSGNVLHCADVPYDDAYQTCGHGRTACGRRGFLCIPGLFTRMAAKRCVRCCLKLGFPMGAGSPKNDDRCRELVKKRIYERLNAGRRFG